MTILSAVSWEKLVSDLEIKEDGNLKIYIDNSSSDKVYFDEFIIERTEATVAVVVQENHYYPFGMNMKGIEELDLQSLDNTDEHRFQYNGKEKEESFGLYWNDHGARNLDVQLGRWNGVDPLAEKFVWQSSYCAMDNNPILKNDPTGKSGEVTINKENKVITITSNLIFYGESASAELAKQTASDIQNLWNAANGKVTIDNVEYSVQFNISSQYVDTEGVDGIINSLILSYNKSNEDDIKNNYIEVKEHVEGNISNMAHGGNEGTFQKNNIEGEGTATEAHEYGHGLGLWPGTKDGHPKDIDLRGKGQPGIMYARGTLVDAQYQYNPNARAGDAANGGTLDTNKRKVTQNDIDMLGLQNLNFNDQGKANLGSITSSN